jgi:SAM-dependent methyltransferase
MLAWLKESADPATVTAGPVLELVCGTGMWTEALAGRTDDLTAIDSSPEVIDIARRRCPAYVRFACADILRWEPDRHYQLPKWSNEAFPTARCTAWSRSSWTRHSSAPISMPWLGLRAGDRWR